ncbi:MBL fold metallo-hydrolase [Natronospirillum operosum]|uniref:MBL fold metallo-hydrolase n=1 Tax=Natronospirillum operosum TaxID=2759953 RepID=A0A4Z0W7H7_9GAMM|nr:MBL fold metallo-hydrolase [Natronospirillum operosum]TGG93337.1 MBL fold metallo-hydrolase [Natronospirillum operosum]
MSKISIKTFYDDATNTLTYVVSDPATRDAVVIDPVLDYDPIGSKVSDESYQAVVDYIRAHDLKLHYVLETHAHADHLSSSQLFRDDFPGVKVAISERIRGVQQVFKGVYNLDDTFVTDGRQFDYLIEDFEELQAGSLTIKSLPTPGHTPACSSYLIDDAVFTGDALFMPDFGTGRCDFPAGDARVLYRGVTENLYSLPDETRVFVGHDYQPGGREVAWESTIGNEKANNIQLQADTTEDEFVQFREGKDRTLDAPKLIYQSILVNIEAGHLPAQESNGQRYLKIPLNIRTA